MMLVSENSRDDVTPFCPVIESGPTVGVNECIPRIVTVSGELVDHHVFQRDLWRNILSFSRVNSFLFRIHIEIGAGSRRRGQ